MNECNEVVIEFNLKRWHVVALAILLAAIAIPMVVVLSSGEVDARPDSQTKATQTESLRQYYLTSSSHYGSVASTSCASGYHMASLWEIADPSNLQYNTSLGATTDDSGDGPPSNDRGWIRTGYISDLSETSGHANCAGWTSHGFYTYGSTAQLAPTWNTGIQDLGVWELGTMECDDWIKVWCIEDL